MIQAPANAKVGGEEPAENVLEQPQPMKNSFEMGKQEHSGVWLGLVTCACNPTCCGFKGRLEKSTFQRFVGKSCLQVKVKGTGNAA